METSHSPNHVISRGCSTFVQRSSTLSIVFSFHYNQCYIAIWYGILQLKLQFEIQSFRGSSQFTEQQRKSRPHFNSVEYIQKELWEVTCFVIFAVIINIRRTAASVRYPLLTFAMSFYFSPVLCEHTNTKQTRPYYCGTVR